MIMLVLIKLQLSKVDKGNEKKQRNVVFYDIFHYLQLFHIFCCV